MKINNTADLSTAIKFLEAKRFQQKQDLVKQFTKTYESMNPVNLIKNTIAEVTNTPGVGDNILNFSIGIGAGIVTKKLFIGKSNSILKKIVGGAIEYGITNLVASNGGFLKQKGMQFLTNFLNKSKENKGITY